MTSFKAQGHNLDLRHPGYLHSARPARTTCRPRRAELEANPKALPAFHGPLRSAFTQTDRHHHLEVQPATADYAPQSPRIDWATLLHRTFDIDVRVCGLCGGHLRVLALITDSGVASRILGALDLSPQAPPLARARDPDDDWDAAPEQAEAF
jgi:hypothetical protein